MYRAHLRQTTMRSFSLIKGLMMPAVPLPQPGSRSGQIPDQPPMHRRPMHSKDDQNPSRPSESRRPTKTSNSRWPNRPDVADELADDCRTSPDRGQTAIRYAVPHLDPLITRCWYALRRPQLLERWTMRSHQASRMRVGQVDALP